ncbi:MAG: uroporphyrinogen-III C-methyltransferase [Coxiellaceae bacterium]|nr:uroporphyrinogen-III C-methyltransferase [Coxiellaceae bacterium]
MSNDTAVANNKDNKVNKSKPEKKSGCPYAKWGIILSVVLALLAIALSWVIWVRSQQQWSQSQQQLHSQLQTLNQQNATTFANMTSKVSQLTRRVNEAASQSGSMRALNQADYFVRMANLSLNFSHNPLTASRILQQADQQLVNADNPALNPVRQQILADIGKLTNQNHIDVTSTLLQLNQLIDQVIKLKVIPNGLPAKSTNKQEKMPSDWRGGLNHAWKQLKSLVVIRHQDQNIVPLLTPERFNFLKENISLQLVEAQWAVLHQSNALYQQSLINAVNWLNKYDNHNQASVGPIIKQLEKLAKLNAKPNYPNLLDTLKLIETTKQQLHQPGHDNTSPATKAATPKQTLPSILSEKSSSTTEPTKAKPKDDTPSLKKLLPKTNKSVEI